MSSFLDNTGLDFLLEKLKKNFDKKADSGTTLADYGITDAATSAQGTKADSAVQTIQINGTTQTKTNGVVNLPAYPTSLPANGGTATKATQDGSGNVITSTYATKTEVNAKYTKPSTGIPATDLASGVIPTSLPASNTTDTYSATGTAPVSGKAVASAISGLDVTGTTSFGAGKTISAWSETDGKISITSQNISITKSQVSDFPTSMPASDVSAWAKASSKPTYTASEVGALASTVTHLSGDIATSQKGTANGVATLDANGLVPSSQLPSFVDDVLEYSAKSSFPSTGETGKIYVDTSKNLTYRWSGTAYVEISPSIALGETSSTAYAGDKGKANADAISALQTTVAGKGTYSKPSGGIPKTDLASAVQTSLGKADSAIQSVTTAAGTNIGSVGTPSVSASTSGTTTTLTFNYLKGAKGDKGDPGTNGTNGTTPTIKAANGTNVGTVGTPSVTASTSGTETTFTFNYLKGAKGDKGDPGQNATTTAVATTSANGLMSSAMVTKLNGIATGATANTGTVTSVAVKMNGTSKGSVTTSGTIDLGTVLTSHQDISGKMDKVNPTGTGALKINANSYGDYCATDSVGSSIAIGAMVSAIGFGSKATGISSAPATQVIQNLSTGTNVDTVVNTWKNSHFMLAMQQGSVAEGIDTLSVGSQSHAEGGYTIAKGNSAHSEGYYTIASGNYSHAEGSGTIASGNSQHVQGKYNVEDTAGTYAHIIGGGTSNTARSNIHTIDWSGNAEFAGTVSSGGNKLATETWVTNKGYTSNAGTVTSVAVKMNNTTKGTVTSSGTIDLGTVLTSHQDISGKVDKTGTSTITINKSLTDTTQYSSLSNSSLSIANNSSNLQTTISATGIVGYAAQGKVKFSIINNSGGNANAYFSGNLTTDGDVTAHDASGNAISMSSLSNMLLVAQTSCKANGVKGMHNYTPTAYTGYVPIGILGYEAAATEAAGLSIYNLTLKGGKINIGWSNAVASTGVLNVLVLYAKTGTVNMTV